MHYKIISWISISTRIGLTIISIFLAMFATVGIYRSIIDAEYRKKYLKTAIFLCILCFIFVRGAITA